MKAKPLEWVVVSDREFLWGYGLHGKFATVTNGKSIDLWIGRDLEVCEFDSQDAAKAHAEQLHQAAFAELIEKWGVKDE